MNQGKIFNFTGDSACLKLLFNDKSGF